MEEIRQQFAQLNNNIISTQSCKALKYFDKRASELKEQYINNNLIGRKGKSLVLKQYKKTKKLIKSMKKRVYLF